ncbi:MAG: MarR family transcriptional regulator [Actinobacteria bacterium]|nr:MarR family transcriptional regulator [Actinomycetota bacterium]
MSVAAADRRTEALAAVREEYSALLASERRLRGRDQHHKPDDGLTIAHVRALFALDKSKAATAGEVAEAARLSPASVTAMLDDLERDGIVTRVRCDTDRRRVLVALTEKGRTVLAKRRRLWLKRWETALADVPDHDLEAAADVLRRITAILDDL